MNELNSLWQALQQHATNTPEKSALIFQNDVISYSQLSQQVELTCKVFADLELQRGDRVIWYGMNHPEMLILLFAAARSGLILVPLNWRLALPELQHIVQDCQPAMIFHDQHFVENILALRQSSDADCGSMLVTPSTEHDGHLPAFRSEVANQPIGELPEPELVQHDHDLELMIVYTSGTTGKPKGAVLTQQSFLCNARMSWDMHDMGAADRVLGLLPMFHVGGFNIQLLPALLVGATVIVMEKFDPVVAIEHFTQQEITLAVVVPTVLQALLAQATWAAANLEKLRALAIGSTDVPVALIEAVHNQGIPLLQIYGATETSPTAIYQRPDNAFNSVGSIGQCGSECEIRLVMDGQNVEPGENGEIWVKGKNILNRYWNNPHATDENIVDGWFRTGDVARCDTDGFYWFADRLKHVIISGGENIYAAELERVIRDFPGTRELTIVGRPDEKWGEVAVVVAVAEEEVDAQDLKEQILARFIDKLARFKHPKDVIFVDALPRTALGKVQIDKVKALFQ